MIEWLILGLILQSTTRALLWHAVFMVEEDQRYPSNIQVKNSSKQYPLTLLVKLRPLNIITLIKLVVFDAVTSSSNRFTHSCLVDSTIFMNLTSPLSTKGESGILPTVYWSNLRWFPLLHESCPILSLFRDTCLFTLLFSKGFTVCLFSLNTDFDILWPFLGSKSA